MSEWLSADKKLIIGVLLCPFTLALLGEPLYSAYTGFGIGGLLTSGVAIGLAVASPVLLWQAKQELGGVSL